MLVKFNRFLAILRSRRVGFFEKSGSSVIRSTDRRRAPLMLTVASQQVEHSTEIAGLKRGDQLALSNRIVRLYPFLYPFNGLLRVGGSLR